MPQRKKPALERLVTAVVFLTLVGSIVYLIFRMSAAPTDGAQPYERTKSDYTLMLAQCALGVAAMLLPGLIAKKLRISIPSGMLILYAVFLYCAVYLGEVRSFYYRFEHFDTVLHCFSGAMLGALGFSFITLLNKLERVPMSLSPFFVALFAFCFAIALDVLWEIYEYVMDGAMGLNMQKFALENGVELTGRDALSDTMTDLIVDSLGAFFISAIGYVSLKYKKGWIEKLQIRREATNAKQ